MKASKIINDPVHGFIEIPYGILLELIDTGIFQRLRRISQLALSSLVYPGAVHSRFNHAIGAMFLTRQAMEVLRSKNVEISDEEYLAASIAILLHDIGHGPFSHALERVILQGLDHEIMSRAIMQHLNQQYEGQLSMAISIFEGTYNKKFLHQLVSSQLDMDRMDYLVRDSYFTGVVEGLVSADRIIKTLNVRNDQLVVEAKGIYSVENFIQARRLMYWQVYLHKAVLSAEFLIVNILKRARELMYSGKEIWKNEPIEFFFRENTILPVDISAEMIERYTALDDHDILYAIKQWKSCDDRVLSTLCSNLLERKLYKTKLQNVPFSPEEVEEAREKLMQETGFTKPEAAYFVFSGQISNWAYKLGDEEPITILHKDDSLQDISDASDMHNVLALSEEVKKYFLAGG